MESLIEYLWDVCVNASVPHSTPRGIANLTVHLSNVRDVM